MRWRRDCLNHSLKSQLVARACSPTRSNQRNSLRTYVHTRKSAHHLLRLLLLYHMLRIMWKHCQLLLFLTACASSEPAVRTLQETNVTGSCAFLDFGKAIECSEVSLVGNDIRYVVSCPPDTQSIKDCFDQNKQVCYQYNGVPCSQGTYCAAENQLSLDCGNIFSKSLGSPCSGTDCSGTCVSLVDEVVSYPKTENSCTSLGSVTTCLTEDSSSGECALEMNEWIDILEDSTRIFASITVSSDGERAACQVRTARGDLCSCQTGCTSNSKALSYDCSNASSDVCAAKDCQGNCVNNALFGPVVPSTSQPTSTPVSSRPNAINWGRFTTEQPVMSPTRAPVAALATAPPVRPLPVTFTPKEEVASVFSPFTFPPSPWTMTSSSNSEGVFFQESGNELAQGSEQIVMEPQQPPLAEQQLPLAQEQVVSSSVPPPPPPPTLQLSPGSAPGVVVFQVSNPEFLGPQVSHPWFQRLVGRGGGGRQLLTTSHGGAHSPRGWIYVLTAITCFGMYLV